MLNDHTAKQDGFRAHYRAARRIALDPAHAVIGLFIRLYRAPILKLFVRNITILYDKIMTCVCVCVGGGLDHAFISLCKCQ